MKLKLTRLLSLILVMFAMSQTALANHYYSKVTAHVVDPSGAGKVYVSNSNSVPNSGQYATPSHSNKQDYETNNPLSSGHSFTYYLYAQASAGYYFVGWYENENCSGTPNVSRPYQVKFDANSENESNPTHVQRWAKFTSITPTFTLSEGEYYGPRTVEIKCETTPGATISYRTNPNSNWQTYSGPISVTATTTIYAKAEKANGGVTYSGESQATYTILKYDVVFISEKSIPFADGDYTLTTGITDGVDVKTDGTATASNSANTSVATTSGSTITPVAVGTTTITVTAAEGPTYLAGSETVTITVTAPEGLTEGAPSTPETYTIPDSGIGTYCSQYPIDLTKLPAGVVPYTVKENTGSLVRFRQITVDNIKGGVGVIYKGEPETVITFSYADSENDPTENSLLVGTLAPTYLAAGTAYGLKSGEFHPNKAGTINAHRAYVPAEGNAVKVLAVEFEEEDPTGIEEFKFEDDSNSVIYNLSGQRIQKMQKGINIVNGKKILK